VQEDGHVKIRIRAGISACPRAEQHDPGQPGPVKALEMGSQRAEKLFLWALEYI
jgi:hypothetical protein